MEKVGQLRFGLKKNERRDRDERQVGGKSRKGSGFRQPFIVFLVIGENRKIGN